MKSNILRVSEGPEPTASLAPVPLWLVILFGLLFYGGQLYLDRHGGGFQPQVYEPYYSLKYVEDLQPKTEGGLMAAQGKKLFDLACAACHQPNGMGAAGVAPPLAGSEWVLAPGPNRVVRIAQDGLQGAIKVKGVDFNLVMPAMGRDLGWSDEDLAAVVTHIRRNKEWGNNASAVTPEQVKAIRAKETARATAWTVEELMAVPESD